MKYLLGSVLLGFAMIAHAGDQSLNVDPSATSFVINLPSNPSTGYQWSVLSYDKNLLSLSGTKYQAAKTGLVGSGGETYYTFTLNQDKFYPAQTILSFKYARPWEHNEGSVKKITVNFKK
jgi:inhibitor of cysteine peptidase